MKLYRTSRGHFVEQRGLSYRLPDISWDALVTHQDLHSLLTRTIESGAPATDFAEAEVLAPIESQEVWAAGVTYYRSRSARSRGVDGRRPEETFTIASTRPSALNSSSKPPPAGSQAPAPGSAFAKTHPGRFLSQS